jgi:hypothetical protein
MSGGILRATPHAVQVRLALSCFALKCYLRKLLPLIYHFNFRADFLRRP